MKIEPMVGTLKTVGLVIVVVAFPLTNGSALAASGTWINTAGGNWSNAANWSGGTIADGATFTGDFSTLDITSNIIITIDTTSRTLGILNIGDSNGSNSYTITRNGGATLTFDNGGSNAQLNVIATSAGDSLDQDIRLKDSLDIANPSANTLTFSGSIQSSATSGIQVLSLLSGNADIISAISNGGTGGTIAVNKSGDGTLTVSGSNTYTGGTTVSGGTLALGNSLSGTPLGTGTLTLSDGVTVRSTGAGLINNRTVQNAVSVSGTVTLGNAVNNGTVIFNGTSLGNGVTLTGNTTLFTASAAVIDNVISGAFSLTKDGTSQLTLTNANTYSGGTFIEGGALRFSNSSALGSGDVTIGAPGGGPTTLSWVGGTATISNNITVATGGFRFLETATGAPTYSGTVTLNGNLSVISAAAGVTLNGTISGVGGIMLISSGQLTLSGANTYSGGTTVNTPGATLIANGDGTLGTGNVSLTAGSVTLTLQGGVSQNYIADTATLSYVNTDVINLNYNGSDTIAGLIVDGVAQAPGTYGAGAINPDGAFTGTGFIVVVPEPSTLILLMSAAALAGTGYLRRRHFGRISHRA